MSINHPKQKQIRLPFSVPRPKTSQPQSRICGICRKRDSQYTCPRCNVPYCSLDCFKDQSHVQCSEPFYKATVLDSIAADPKADMEEKKRMMEMLKRFEDAQAEGEGFISDLDRDDQDEGAESDEDDELERALAGMDIESLDSNKLFHLLPQHHRDAFLHALRNPESDEAKELLELATKDEESLDDLPDVLPWWESNDLDDDRDKIDTASVPEIVDQDVLSAITPPSGIGSKLCYNAIAISLAYLHVLLSYRLPSLHDDYTSQTNIDDIKRYFSILVPFLSDPKSTTRFTNVREAWTGVWEAIGAESDTPPSPSILIRLLNILPSLLQPPILADERPKLISLLSDMYNLYARPKPGAGVPRKLAFYIVALGQLERNEWLNLRKEVEKEISRLEDENGDGDGDEGVEQGEEERPALLV